MNHFMIQRRRKHKYQMFFVNTYWQETGKTNMSKRIPFLSMYKWLIPYRKNPKKIYFRRYVIKWIPYCIPQASGVFNEYWILNEIHLYSNLNPFVRHFIFQDLLIRKCWRSYGHIWMCKKLNFIQEKPFFSHRMFCNTNML